MLNISLSASWPFDFNHFEAVTADELDKVEALVNRKIDEFLPIEMKEMPIEEAKKMGAMAIFGEKYGDIVRVVSMGDYSVEFCGGTHLQNTGLIGGIKLTAEYGVASGVRRIEAVTGSNVVNYLNKKQAVINEVSSILKSNENDLARRAKQVVADNKELEATIKALKSDEISGSVDEIIASGTKINDVLLITRKFEDTDAEQLRNITDAVKEKTDNVVMIFAAVNSGKLMFIASVSDDLVGKGYHAGKIIKEVASVCGGGGGGKANMAQAGAKDASKIDDAFEKAKELI